MGPNNPNGQETDSNGCLKRENWLFVDCTCWEMKQVSVCLHHCDWVALLLTLFECVQIHCMRAINCIRYALILVKNF